MQIPILHVESSKTFNSACKSQVTDLNTDVHTEDIPWMVVHNLGTQKLPVITIMSIIKIELKIIQFWESGL